MGCGASNGKSNGTPGPPRPRTATGRTHQKNLDKAFSKLKAGVDSSTNVGEKIEAIKASLYLDLLEETTKSSYASGSDEDVVHFDCGWMSVSIPDTGQFVLKQNLQIGSVTVEVPDPRKKKLALSLGFTCGTMRSDVDTDGYCKLFREKIEAMFSNLPVRLATGNYVTSFEMTPATPVSMGGIDMREWMQYSGTALPSSPTVEIGRGAQLELHGMRNESSMETYGSSHYGFNVTCVMGMLGVHELIEPTVREILKTVVIKDRATVEKHLGHIWDKMGR